MLEENLMAEKRHPTPTPEYLFNWETYSYKDVSFQYPGLFGKVPNNGNGESINESFETGGALYSMNFVSHPNINKETNKPYTSLLETKNLIYSEEEFSWAPFNLGGRSAFRSSWILTRSTAAHYDKYIHFFSKDKHILFTARFRIHSLDDKDFAVANSYFDQILSTFKFTQ